MRSHVVLFCVAVSLSFQACSGCSDETKVADCATNEVVNPITGECEPMGRLGNNNRNNDGSDGGLSDATSTDASNNGVIIADVDTPDVSACAPGNVLGCSDETSRFVCNDDGTGYDAVSCGADEWCLLGTCGDQRCTPGTQACIDPATVGVCDADGLEIGSPQPCEDGNVCEEGTCKTICDLGAKSFSYIGCEYWTVDLDQYTDPSLNPKPDAIPHSVVISNPGLTDATISFNVGEPGFFVNAPDPVVPAGEARAFTMPRMDVTGTGISFRAIQILSTTPVIAHQFSPLNNANVFSNDASLLLPATENGTEYYVMGWLTGVPPAIFNFPPQHGYATIVAANGAANVTITTTSPIRGGPGFAAMVEGETRTITLNRGQVLNLESWGPNVGVYDITGTHIVSDVPVAVFAGHEEAVIGEDRPNDDGGCCADHLQQQLFPVNTWGSEYLAPASPTRGGSNDVWRILASENNTTITTDPPQPGANNVTINAGQFVEFEVNASFSVSASAPISVGQFLVSQDHTDDGNGDPAFTLLPAVEQFRADYYLLTPTGYAVDYVLVIRKAGSEVIIDGNAINVPFTQIGSSGYERGVVTVQPGLHVMTGAEPFGIIAYGFDSAVSYAYPGGLNLVGINEDP